MKHTHTIIRISMFVSGVLLTLCPSLLAHAQSFHLDFDSTQTDVSELSGGDRILQGGLTPQQTYGAADTIQIHPLAAVTSCENGACSSSQASSDQSDTVQEGNHDTSGGRRNLAPEKQQEPSENAIPSPLHLSAPLENGSQPALPQESQDAENPTGQQDTYELVPALPSSVVQRTGSQESDNGSLGANEVEVKSPEHSPSNAAESAAGAIALGSMSVTQAGILARLSWIARIKNLYGVIPAFS